MNRSSIAECGCSHATPLLLWTRADKLFRVFLSNAGCRKLLHVGNPAREICSESEQFVGSVKSDKNALLVLKSGRGKRRCSNLLSHRRLRQRVDRKNARLSFGINVALRRPSQGHGSESRALATKEPDLPKLPPRYAWGGAGMRVPATPPCNHLRFLFLTTQLKVLTCATLAGKARFFW